MGLNARRRETAKFLTNPRAMHAAVEACFPPHYDDKNPRSLWRLERVNNSVTLWLVSDRCPSFEHLQEQGGWSQEVTWETRNYDQLLDRLQRGQRYSFRLTANPVKDTLCEDGKKRRVPLFREEDQVNWLLTRSAKNGFSASNDEGAPTFAITESRQVRFRHDNSTVTLQKCTFEGVLSVSDPQLLRNALVSGIGKGKAYGLGMITLAPYSGG
ncbi:type I-E CRISPR-associated protein Cas6/Cse3/CasE [Corynebacterium felinum]|nr:type I-E CRISPR-associated protein Cas6/Cse3/CasE [Corynebacterium felinum]MDF5820572.1 type I-E CRISPR-associated protein Cas6/Cse3/CasE [Corynebacterium felinum]